MTNRFLRLPFRPFIVAAATVLASVTVANAQGAQPQGIGTVNTVDPAGHKINITHKPIPELGWPTMKMDFAVAGSVDLAAVKPGAQVEFQLAKNAKGAYEIQAIKPVATGK